jgi:hypothetical protein
LIYCTRYGQEQALDLLDLILRKELLIEKALDVNLSKKGEGTSSFQELTKMWKGSAGTSRRTSRISASSRK